jgi:hypothetical protein
MKGMTGYPVSVRGDLSQPPARGWWLLKWLLAIPHFIVLAFLWVAFIAAVIIAFFSILFTEKYPKGLFEFNAGVLRWTWRVAFYSYSALATDKYPSFSLQADENYPADLTIEYPSRLSRGLVLVKWWLLAIPHYVIVAFFQGSSESGGGLVNVLAFFAAVALLFTGRYPADIFKLVIGINRWGIRVAAYAFLMTDQYPPFRLWDE